MTNNNLNEDLKKNLDWSLFGTGPAMIEAFRKGELDIGYMGLPPAIIGIDQEVNIRCVAGGHIEGTVMIGKKNYKNILDSNNDIHETLAQFKGKIIGAPSKGSIHDVIINYYLEKSNLQDEIEVKNYEQAELIALDMKKDLIEGGVGTPALAIFASTLLNSHLIIQPDKLWKNNPSYGVFFPENLIRNHPDYVIKFLSYHKKASYLIRNSQMEAAEIISNTIKIVDKHYIKSILEISPKYCISLSKGYVDSTMEFVKTLYDLGYIKKSLKILDIFNFEFIKRVHPENEHYSN